MDCKVLPTLPGHNIDTLFGSDWVDFSTLENYQGEGLSWIGRPCLGLEYSYKADNWTNTFGQKLIFLYLFFIPEATKLISMAIFG